MKADLYALVEAISFPARDGTNARGKMKRQLSDELRVTRRFRITSDEGNTVVPEYFGRANAGMFLEVFYAQGASIDQQDTAIHEDARLLSSALADPANWGTRESGIVSVDDGGRDAFPYTIEPVEEGGRILRIAFPVQYVA